MKYISNYGDVRQLLYCAFCGGKTENKDHCPSRVFLDKPYPENLSVVPACLKCNSDFSIDEEYLACLISCILAGKTNPSSINREKTRRILTKKKKLRSRIEQSRVESGGMVIFKPEYDRVSNVIVKLAQGHALYELNEPCPNSPDAILVKPLLEMDKTEQCTFESPEPPSFFPEVGSRAMQRLFINENSAYSPWINVQTERYRYNATHSHGVEIRIVINEYLAGYVRWD